MVKSKSHVYSHYSMKAAGLLGHLILLYRRKRKITAADLADRAGISRTTLYKIEQGNLRCEIGLVFEVATLVGIQLFDSDKATLDSLSERIEDKITLLPKRIRKREFNDEF